MIVVGTGLSAAAAHALGWGRTYFGVELGFDAPARITRFPYGFVPHPMFVGSAIALVGLELSPALREAWPWLVPAHLGLYALHLAQEAFDRRAPEVDVEYHDTDRDPELAKEEEDWGDTPAWDAAQCEEKRKEFRRGADGRKHYMIVTEDSASVLSMGDANPISGDFVLNMTPFFSAGDSAITHQAPSKTDANGNAVLPYLRIPSKIPDGWTMQLMNRQVQARALRIQLVFTPEGVWSLPKKGGGQIRGIKTRFDGVIVQIGRTGETIGLWYPTK
jgi:hypothetical protein